MKLEFLIFPDTSAAMVSVMRAPRSLEPQDHFLIL